MDLIDSENERAFLDTMKDLRILKSPRVKTDRLMRSVKDPEFKKPSLFKQLMGARRPSSSKVKSKIMKTIVDRNIELVQFSNVKTAKNANLMDK